MNIKFALATATFIAMGFASTQLAAHNSVAVPIAAALDGAGKTDRLARADRAPASGIRVVAPSYLPSEQDGIDLVRIGTDRLDPANRAFVQVVSWIGAQETGAATQMAAR